jgi:hypothetical protein
MENGNYDNAFHKLVGRGMIDPDFRESLLNGTRQDLGAALEWAGVVEPTEAQIDALAAAVGGLNTLQEQLGGGIHPMVG